ncbi:C-C motif chemokine 5 [Xenopus laevis]|uniref:C-C motif chemokine 5 n=2 Tax=Xenopus laevis TaxID=8355 RepID=A0A1L8HDW4_XENLA|nr:C-C motif chemokine 5 [Xenopus laevis]OCT94265.1 hypothetical protein XELAEV_18011933mg [Xenopus laevis]
MKAALITLTVFLFVAFYNEAESAPVGSDVVSCCFDFMKKAVPTRHMADYFYTSSRCSQFAVVLVTRKNRKICANPEDEWVKNIINALEMPEAV